MKHCSAVTMVCPSRLSSQKRERIFRLTSRSSFSFSCKLVSSILFLCLLTVSLYDLRSADKTTNSSPVLYAARGCSWLLCLRANATVDGEEVKAKVPIVLYAAASSVWVSNLLSSSASLQQPRRRGMQGAAGRGAFARHWRTADGRAEMSMTGVLPVKLVTGYDENDTIEPRKGPVVGYVEDALGYTPVDPPSDVERLYEFAALFGHLQDVSLARVPRRASRSGLDIRVVEVTEREEEKKEETFLEADERKGLDLRVVLVNGEEKPAHERDFMQQCPSSLAAADLYGHRYRFYRREVDNEEEKQGKKEAEVSENSRPQHAAASFLPGAIVSEEEEGEEEAGMQCRLPESMRTKEEPEEVKPPLPKLSGNEKEAADFAAQSAVIRCAHREELFKEKEENDNVHSPQQGRQDQEEIKYAFSVSVALSKDDAQELEAAKEQLRSCAGDSAEKEVNMGMEPKRLFHDLRGWSDAHIWDRDGTGFSEDTEKQTSGEEEMKKTHEGALDKEVQDEEKEEGRDEKQEETAITYTEHDEFHPLPDFAQNGGTEERSVVADKFAADTSHPPAIPRRDGNAHLKNCVDLLRVSLKKESYTLNNRQRQLRPPPLVPNVSSSKAISDIDEELKFESVATDHAPKLPIISDEKEKDESGKSAVNEEETEKGLAFEAEDEAEFEPMTELRGRKSRRRLLPVYYYRPWLRLLPEWTRKFVEKEHIESAQQKTKTISLSLPELVRESAAEEQRFVGLRVGPHHHLHPSSAAEEEKARPPFTPSPATEEAEEGAEALIAAAENSEEVCAGPLAQKREEPPFTSRSATQGGEEGMKNVVVSAVESEEVSAVPILLEPNKGALVSPSSVPTLAANAQPPAQTAAAAAALDANGEEAERQTPSTLSAAVDVRESRDDSRVSVKADLKRMEEKLKEPHFSSERVAIAAVLSSREISITIGESLATLKADVAAASTLSAATMMKDAVTLLRLPVGGDTSGILGKSPPTVEPSRLAISPFVMSTPSFVGAAAATFPLAGGVATAPFAVAAASTPLLAAGAMPPAEVAASPLLAATAAKESGNGDGLVLLKKQEGIKTAAGKDAVVRVAGISKAGQEDNKAGKGRKKRKEKKGQRKEGDGLTGGQRGAVTPAAKESVAAESQQEATGGNETNKVCGKQNHCIFLTAVDDAVVQADAKDAVGDAIGRRMKRLAAGAEDTPAIAAEDKNETDENEEEETNGDTSTAEENPWHAAALSTQPLEMKTPLRVEADSFADSVKTTDTKKDFAKKSCRSPSHHVTGPRTEQQHQQHPTKREEALFFRESAAAKRRLSSEPEPLVPHPPSSSARGLPLPGMLSPRISQPQQAPAVGEQKTEAYADKAGKRSNSSNSEGTRLAEAMGDHAAQEAVHPSYGLLEKPKLQQLHHQHQLSKEDKAQPLAIEKQELNQQQQQHLNQKKYKQQGRHSQENSKEQQRQRQQTREQQQQIQNNREQQQKRDTKQDNRHHGDQTEELRQTGNEPLQREAALAGPEKRIEEATSADTAVDGIHKIDEDQASTGKLRETLSWRELERRADAYDRARGVPVKTDAAAASQSCSTKESEGACLDAILQRHCDSWCTAQALQKRGGEMPLWMQLHMQSLPTYWNCVKVGSSILLEKYRPDVEKTLLKGWHVLQELHVELVKHSQQLFVVAQARNQQFRQENPYVWQAASYVVAVLLVCRLLTGRFFILVQVLLAVVSYICCSCCCCRRRRSTALPGDLSIVDPAAVATAHALLADKQMKWLFTQTKKTSFLCEKIKGQLANGTLVSALPAPAPFAAAAPPAPSRGPTVGPAEAGEAGGAVMAVNWYNETGGIAAERRAQVEGGGEGEILAAAPAAAPRTRVHRVRFAEHGTRRRSSTAAMQQEILSLLQQVMQQQRQTAAALQGIGLQQELYETKLQEAAAGYSAMFETNSLQQADANFAILNLTMQVLQKTDPGGVTTERVERLQKKFLAQLDEIHQTVAAIKARQLRALFGLRRAQPVRQPQGEKEESVVAEEVSLVAATAGSHPLAVASGDAGVASATTAASAAPPSPPCLLPVEAAATTAAITDLHSPAFVPPPLSAATSSLPMAGPPPATVQLAALPSPTIAAGPVMLSSPAGTASTAAATAQVLRPAAAAAVAEHSTPAVPATAAAATSLASSFTSQVQRGDEQQPQQATELLALTGFAVGERNLSWLVQQLWRIQRSLPELLLQHGDFYAQLVLTGRTGDTQKQIVLTPDPGALSLSNPSSSSSRHSLYKALGPMSEAVNEVLFGEHARRSSSMSSSEGSFDSSGSGSRAVDMDIKPAPLPGGRAALSNTQRSSSAESHSAPSSQSSVRCRSTLGLPVTPWAVQQKLRELKQHTPASEGEAWGASLLSDSNSSTARSPPAVEARAALAGVPAHTGASYSASSLFASMRSSDGSINVDGDVVVSATPTGAFASPPTAADAAAALASPPSVEENVKSGANLPNGVHYQEQQTKVAGADTGEEGKATEAKTAGATPATAAEATAELAAGGNAEKSVAPFPVRPSPTKHEPKVRRSAAALFGGSDSPYGTPCHRRSSAGGDECFSRSSSMVPCPGAAAVTAAQSPLVPSPPPSHPPAVPLSTEGAGPTAAAVTAPFPFVDAPGLSPAAAAAAPLPLLSSSLPSPRLGPQAHAAAGAAPADHRSVSSGIFSLSPNAGTPRGVSPPPPANAAVPSLVASNGYTTSPAVSSTISANVQSPPPAIVAAAAPSSTSVSPFVPGDAEEGNPPLLSALTGIAAAPGILPSPPSSSHSFTAAAAASMAAASGIAPPLLPSLFAAEALAAAASSFSAAPPPPPAVPPPPPPFAGSTPVAALPTSNSRHYSRDDSYLNGGSPGVHSSLPLPLSAAGHTPPPPPPPPSSASFPQQQVAVAEGKGVPAALGVQPPPPPPEISSHTEEAMLSFLRRGGGRGKEGEGGAAVVPPPLPGPSRERNREAGEGDRGAAAEQLAADTLEGSVFPATFLVPPPPMTSAVSSPPSVAAHGSGVSPPPSGKSPPLGRPSAYSRATRVQRERKEPVKIQASTNPFGFASHQQFGAGGGEGGAGGAGGGSPQDSAA